MTVETSGTAERPIRFEAATGEHVVDHRRGRDPGMEEGAGGATSSAPRGRTASSSWSKAGTHPDDAYHRMIGRCEQVFVLGLSLAPGPRPGRPRQGDVLRRPRRRTDLRLPARRCRPLEGRAAARRGLGAAGPLGGQRGVRPPPGPPIPLRGEHGPAGRGAVRGGPRRRRGLRLRVDELERRVAASPKDLTVRRCVFQENGQLGFGAARAHDLLFTECVVRNNNVKGFDRGWEAGGDKLVLCRGAVLEKSQFVGNRGNGVWFDIGNEGCEVRNCLIADNEDGGIFYEISYGLHAHDNVIVGNGFGPTPGAWGANAGISLSSSPGCLIERNLLVGNREGFDFREQGRTTPRIDDETERPIWNHDEVIRNNVLALNRDAQVWGWFDVDDGRHWPAALQEPARRRRAWPRRGEDAPPGLTLEKLAIRFENNLYDARPWQGLFHWGVDWKRHRTYATSTRSGRS